MRNLGLGLLLLLSACGDDDGATGGGGSGGTGAGAEGGAGGGGAGGPTGEIAATIERYDLVFDFTSLQASSDLALNVAGPGGDCWEVPSEVPASVVRFDGDEIDPAGVTHDGSTLRVCGPGLPAGQHIVGTDGTLVEKTFHGLDVGFSTTADAGGNDFTYLLSWVGGCDHFGPCDDDPSRQLHYSVRIAHPAGTLALCPGVLTPGETSTRCEIAGTRAPTYSAYAAMTNPGWVRTPWITAANVDIVFYEVAPGPIAASLDPTSVTAFMEWIVDLLGPLPYGNELRIAGAPTAWLGFEHPANIVLHEGIGTLNTSYTDTAMHVFMHEVIHQWAGDRTTLASAADFAWKEAMAEYLAYVFEDEQRPAEEALASLAYWDDISLQAAYHVRPLEEPAPAVHEFYGDVYGPGPMLLFVQLEPLIGRAAVLEGIAAFLADEGAKSVEELRLALEAASGADLSTYFEAWVTGVGAPTYPTFTVTTEPDGLGNLTVTVTQSDVEGAPFPCAVEVDVVGATTTSTVEADFGLAPTMSSVEVTIPFAEPVLSTAVDPRHKVVDSPAGGNLQVGPPRQVWIF
jgi:aminopeptidase N